MNICDVLMLCILHLPGGPGMVKPYVVPDVLQIIRSVTFGDFSVTFYC